MKEKGAENIVADEVQLYTESWQSIGTKNSQVDRYLIVPIPGNGLLCAVMDGHGGNSETADTIAAHLAGDFLHEYQKIDTLSTGTLSVRLERQILRRAIARQVRRCRRHLSGSTLSVILIRPMIHTEEQRSVLRLHSAILGDSPIAWTNGKRISQMQFHSAKYCKADIKKISRRILSYQCQMDSITLTPDIEKIINGVFADGWLYTGDSLQKKGIAMTRAIGDHDFGELLIRRPTIRTLELPIDSTVLLASDGVLLEGNSNRDVKGRCRSIFEQLRADVPLYQIGREILSEGLQRRDLLDNLTMISIRTL